MYSFTLCQSRSSARKNIMSIGYKPVYIYSRAYAFDERKREGGNRQVLQPKHVRPRVLIPVQNTHTSKSKAAFSCVVLYTNVDEDDDETPGLVLGTRTRCAPGRIPEETEARGQMLLYILWLFFFSLPLYYDLDSVFLRFTTLWVSFLFFILFFFFYSAI